MSAPHVALEVVAAFVLAKQGLAGSGQDAVLTAIDSTGGVYGTAPTCYLSCAARLADFRLGQLDEQLYEQRTLSRLRAMRGSSYVVPAEVLPFVVAATGQVAVNAYARFVRQCGLSDRACTELTDRIEQVLTGRPSATVAEIRELLGGDVPGRRETLQYAVALMAAEARLARARPRGGWRSDNYTYTPWLDWFGLPLALLEPADGRVELARWYLGAFGPASAADLRWWAGWNARDTAAALAALHADVAEVVITAQDGTPTQAYLPSEHEAALPATDPDAARGVRLLPVWDAYLMGYLDRARLVAADDRPWVYDKAGNATSVVLVDGMVAGVWEHEGDGSGAPFTVRVAPLRPANTRWWGAVEQAATELASAVEASELRFERAPRPGPLADGARNAFLAPIRLAGG